MRNARFVFAALLGTACAAPRVPTPVTVAPVAPLAHVDTKPVKVDAPRDLAAWLHIESPERFGSLVDRISGPMAKDASCAEGDVRACLALGDVHRPFDGAVALSEKGGDVEAIAFSVRSVDDFRAAADKDFRVSEPRQGRLELVPKTKTDKPHPFTCDVSAAGGPDHRVVCSDEKGIERLGPWLLSSPRQQAHDDLARVEVYRAPLVAAADKKWTGDALAFVHDFGGATVTLHAGDAADARVDLDVAVRMREARSPWTKALLAPAAPAGAIPETFARLPKDTTAALYFPGGGPYAALFDLFDAAGLSKLDPAKAKPVIDGAHALLARPMVCAYVVDLDAGRTALANARHASDKDRKKADDALEAALYGHALCGVEAPIKAADQLARKLVQLTPPSGDRYAVRPATGLGLPKGSFLLDTIHPKTPAHGSDTVVTVPDGDTTWFVFATDAADVRRAAKLGTRLLSNPKGAVTTLKAAPADVTTGYATTLLGAFFWDVAMHSYDAIEKTLSSPVQQLQFSVSQKAAESGGTLSLHLSTDVGALPELGKRAGQLMLPLGIFLAAFFMSEDSSKP